MLESQLLFRITWVLFLANQDEALSNLLNYVRKFKNEKGLQSKTRGDHAGKFENHACESFCEENGIDH